MALREAPIKSFHYPITLQFIQYIQPISLVIFSINKKFFHCLQLKGKEKFPLYIVDEIGKMELFSQSFIQVNFLI